MTNVKKIDTGSLVQADFDAAWNIPACWRCRQTYASSEGECGNELALQGAAECGWCLAELIAGIRSTSEKGKTS